MKFLKTYIFFFFVFSIANSFSQSLNDYRTVTNATGNWTTITNWQVYNGTNWVAATNYPGQVTGTNDVYIIDGAQIILDTTIAGTQPINSVTIGDGSGVIEQLIVNGTTPGFNSTELNILTDGLLFFGTNGSDQINLPGGTSISIEPDPTATLGIEHGLYNQNKKGQDCNDAADKVVIGSTIYSDCKGSGSLPSFEDVNNSGGNLTVAPTSNSPVCSGQTVNLFANPGGTEAASASYTWSVISSPVAYAFTSTSEDATDSPAPTTPGTYIYEVTATSGSAPDTITTTSTVSVEIENCNKTVITNRRITYRVKK